MKYFILFVLIVWLLKRFGIFRLLFRSLVTKAVNNQYRGNETTFEQRKEGEIFINKNRSSNNNPGEFTDFEEVK